MTDTIPAYLKCEHLVNPFGIDISNPRLSWITEVSDRGQVQTAYRIQCASSIDLLNNNSPDLWETGCIERSASNLITYEGKPLHSANGVYWRVCIWDKDNRCSQWSQPGYFEIGLLNRLDWRADWISPPVKETNTSGKPHITPAYIRKSITINKPVQKARLYATALGVYKASINGQYISDSEFAPGWTDYNKRVQYQTYDITSLLQDGQNTLITVLGSGWYAGYIGWEGKSKHYGDEPSLLMQLVITYNDGSCETIGTDNTWQYCYGPVEYSDILNGEYYDARNEFDYTGIDNWKSVGIKEVNSSLIINAQPDAPVKVTQDIYPIDIKTIGDGKYIVDMGQNIVGRIHLKVTGDPGTHIVLRYTEMLNADGSIYATNLRSAQQTDHYILKGDGVEEWEPLFTFHGFRYIEVSNFPGVLTNESIIGRHIESYTELSGYLETGHTMVNKLINNISWGQRGNFLSVPTDCPQRDERLGWMGDAQVFVCTAGYNRDVAAFFKKWLQDVVDAQSSDGGFSDVSPRLVDLSDGAPAWGDAGIIVPWTIYLLYDDKRILEEMYEPMAKWVQYIHKNNPDGLWRNNRNNDFGDWLSINADTPKDLLATAYYAYDCQIMSTIAHILGKTSDAGQYSHLYQEIRDAFINEYVYNDGTISGNTQTAYLLALKIGLLPNELKLKAAEHLFNDIKQKDYHLSTGFIGVGYLCPVLSEIGYDDIAYRLLLNDTFPSWGYSIKQGATTIWERWDGWTVEKGFQDPSMNSFNHYSLGSIGEWLYRYAAGIDIDPAYPGFKHIVMKPTPSKEIGYMNAGFKSPYGLIKSNWKYQDSKWLWDIVIPANTSATLNIPASSLQNITENNKQLSQSEGLTVISESLGRVICEAVSGSYKFSVSL